MNIGTPVVVTHFNVGRYCHCSCCRTVPPAGIPELTPGTKGRIIHLTASDATVEFDGHQHPVIVSNPAHFLRADNFTTTNHE